MKFIKLHHREYGYRVSQNYKKLKRMLDRKKHVVLVWNTSVLGIQDFTTTIARRTNYAKNVYDFGIINFDNGDQRWLRCNEDNFFDYCNRMNVKYIKQ